MSCWRGKASREAESAVGPRLASKLEFMQNPMERAALARLVYYAGDKAKPRMACNSLFGFLVVIGRQLEFTVIFGDG